MKNEAMKKRDKEMDKRGRAVQLRDGRSDAMVPLRALTITHSLHPKAQKVTSRLGQTLLLVGSENSSKVLL